MPERDDEILGGTFDFDTISSRIGRIVLEPRSHGWKWFGVFALGFLFVNVLALSIAWVFQRGIGIWGNDTPTAWGFPIVSFVWWIGIGHAGTFISAFLYVMRQKWRNSINRFAEAMTIFAVLCAGMYPVLHLGRPWLAYWLAPYPNQMGVWPQFRSPLVWDFFAVSTYLTVSVLFWGMALIPDYASFRDRVKKTWLKRVFGVISLGWSGDAEHWHRFEQAYLILAALATALVISVHSIVGLDFAVAQLPTWHSTIIPPYFVAGAIFSGFAMLLVLLIPLRAWYRLQELITMRHIDWMVKITLATSLIVGYSYLNEIFLSYYGSDIYERTVMNALLFGPFRPLYYSLIFFNAVLPLALWSPRIRRHLPSVFVIAFLAVVGMWLERYMIVTVPLRRDFLPSSWGVFRPTVWDYGTLFGTVGFFVMMLFLFLRWAPPITIFEMRETLHEAQPETSAVLLSAPPEANLHVYGGKVLGAVVAFDRPESLMAAVREVRDAGYRNVRAFTPFPVKGLSEALGIRDYRMPWIMFGSGIAGAAGAYALQAYINLYDYPLNSGGRPFHSWPAFVPVTYECTILLASLAGFFGMLTLNGMPRIADPIFSAPDIDRATRDRFLLYISSTDPMFSEQGTLRYLQGGVREAVLL